MDDIAFFLIMKNLNADNGWDSISTRMIKLREKKQPYQLIFFSIWVFFHDHSRITGLKGNGEGISLASHYHFHLLHTQLHNSGAIAAESSPLHISIAAGFEQGTIGFRVQVANH